MVALNVDYIAWIIIVSEAFNSNQTFILDLNYLLWKLKPLKRQVVKFLARNKKQSFSIWKETTSWKSSLKIIVANAQLSVTFATGGL